MEKLLNRTLAAQLADMQQRRAEWLVTTLANGRGCHLSRDQIIDRANLERAYKQKRVWVRSKDGSELGQYYCLDFGADGMKARCVDRANELHIFDPEEVEFESRAERTLRFAQNRAARLSRQLEEVKKLLARIDAEKGRVDRMIRRAHNEIARERKRVKLDRFLSREEGEKGGSRGNP